MNVEERPRSSLHDKSDSARRLARLVIAITVAGLVCSLAWLHIGTTLSGKSNVVGYPLFADFNVNRYLDAFYIAALVFPLLTLIIFDVLARFGPLRRSANPRHALRSDRHDTDDNGGDGDGDGDNGVGTPIRPTTTAVRAARLFAIGALLDLEEQSGFRSGSMSTLTTMAIAGICFAVFALVTSLVVERTTHRRVSWTSCSDWVGGVGAIAMVPLLYFVSRATRIYVDSTGDYVHYPWLPLWSVVTVTALLIAYALYRRARAPRDSERTEHNLIYFVAVPIAIFTVFAAIPGALGPLDPFGEGEFLAGGWLLMHGSVPWRDLYLIHGVLDDGLKGIVGMQVFGRTRWGATTGMTMLLIPLYWVFTYYFAAVVFARRSMFVLCCAAAITLGIFVNWDLRFGLWPLVLVLLYRVLEHRTPGRVIALVTALVAQAILIPEMSYALIACGATLVAFELYERGGSGIRLRDLRATAWSIVSSVVIGGGFVVWLEYEHAMSGFIGYFKDFATAHSLTGGIPLFTTYAVATLPNALGVTIHATQSPPLLTRYSLELLLPVFAIVATIALVCIRVRSGRRLTSHDWLCVAAAILVALYYQKGVSRADEGHIAEVFEVTVPLIMVLSYRALFGLELVFKRLEALDRWHALAGRVRRFSPISIGRSPVAFMTLVVVLVVAPISVAGLVDPVPSHFEASVPAPAAPPEVTGAPGLGYAYEALPSGVVHDIEQIFNRYAGASGPVFDFSNAPAIVNFLLDRKPVSRFYDVGDIATISAQQDAISDLERSRPIVVLFNGIGMGAWDFIPNEIRDSVLSDWLLSHYRPLVLADGQLLLVSNTVVHPKPLPHLLGAVRTRSLYYRMGKCAWGFIPDYLDSTITTGARTASVALEEKARTKSGTIYRFVAPSQLKAFHWISVTIAGATGNVGLSISDVGRVSNRDISWVAQGSGTTQVEVASCIQWHGFGRVLDLRYLGRGTPTAISLIG